MFGNNTIHNRIDIKKTVIAEVCIKRFF